MKQFCLFVSKNLLILVFAFSLSNYALGQVSEDYAVELSAQLNKTNKTITLNWKSNANITNYKLYLKSKDSKNKDIWQDLNSTSTNSYVFDSVEIGKLYEFKVLGKGSKLNAYGYISSGIEVKDFGNKGILVLLVDDTCSQMLPKEVKRLENDLAGEGWQVIRANVKRKSKVSEVKATLLTIWNQNNQNLKGIFLLGRIPVPYSGTFAPDGHTDHQGAWPADVYYTSLNNDGDWSDFVNLTTASRTENKNYNGDGKFDQDIIPATPDAMIGRVDLSNMTGFGLSESALMKRYLDKDHNFRTGQVKVNHRAILCDNFGAMGGEAFAASGFKAYSPLIGFDKIQTTGYYATEVKSKDFLFTYGTGGGWYTSAAGIGTSDSFFTGQFKGVFNMLFGSYFGDWDYQNNFLRSPLAADGLGLTCAWSGRPHWIMHQMGMNSTIGDCAKISQYDTNMYFRHPNSSFGATRQIALMGDPTLRAYPMNQIKNLKVAVKDDAAKKQSSVQINWNSTEAGLNGFLVYKARTLSSPMQLLTPNPITDSAFIDNAPINGKSYYIVKSVKLYTSPSGSFYNTSTGLLDSATTTYGVGMESVTSLNHNLIVYPNPAQNVLNIKLNDNAEGISKVSIYQIDGKLIMDLSYNQDNNVSVNIADLSNGIYHIKIQSGNQYGYLKFVRGR